MLEALAGFAALVALIMIRVPIALAMALTGFLGFSLLLGLSADNILEFRWSRPLSMATQRVIGTAMQYGLSVIPMFLLMGAIVSRTGLSEDLYRACNSLLGRLRGGLAIATVVTCGFFSAICGSSLATTSTMSKVAMPHMRAYGYHDSLSTASIAAGGTLGILIPPSVILVIYGLMTETSIQSLFAAGLLPGILGIALYAAAVRYVVWRKPEAGPPASLKKAQASTSGGVWGTVAIFVIGIGGIYAGVFTPTEAAGVSAASAALLAAKRGKMSVTVMRDSLIEAARTTAMLFSLLIGALIFSTFVNRTTMTGDIISFVSGHNIPPYAVLTLILAFYIVMGMVFESLSMLLLTVPVFFPLMIELGYDPVWFGIIAVVVTEISLITPPVGLNVFVLASMLPDVRISTIFRGVTPFWIADIARLALLAIFPAISLLLPRLFYG